MALRTTALGWWRSRAGLSALALLALIVGCGEPRLQVTILGIDGATWRVIDPLLARGELPNLQHLIDSGVRAPLRSERPLISPAIWTTIATGASREQHGIRRFAKSGAGLVSTRDRQVPALWTLASRQGLRSAVIGWWATYPAEAIEGAIVSERALKTREEDLHLRFRGGLRAPELARLTHPPEALELLAATLFQMPERTEGETDEDWLLTRVRAEDVAALATLAGLRDGMGPFDLELVLVRGVDPVSHTFWRYYEPDAAAYAELPLMSEGEAARYASAVEDHYRFVDALLGDLPARSTSDRVTFVLSDHGFSAHVETLPRGTVITGHHKDAEAVDGIFIAAGGPVRGGGGRATGASIYDIAPTVLHLLGLEVADTLAGSVLSEIFEPEWAAAHPVRRRDAYPGPPVDLTEGAESGDRDSGVDARLREELRALGYIE
jgi:predicted AlkP superfamily phosphohydrolase/phosphomutase